MLHKSEESKNTKKLRVGWKKLREIEQGLENKHKNLVFLGFDAESSSTAGSKNAPLFAVELSKEQLDEASALDLVASGGSRDSAFGDLRNATPMLSLDDRSILAQVGGSLHSR